MYGIGSVGHQESEEEYDVFSEVEKEMVVKTYSKESASSKIQWNKRHEQDEQLQNFRELAVIPNPTRDTHRTASHDTSSRLDSSSAAGHAGNFASSNNFIGNKSPTPQKREDFEAASSHFSSSGLHGESSSTDQQHHRQSKDNNFPGALSKMSIGAAYGALKTMKPNKN
uniref:Uncharacterized protein n=1 Tax=Daphnia galeata TaxID=27404 RepID=A0A8J2RHA6_9CRUS|nr:unnamed protein product [Daphnia galeata]